MMDDVYVWARAILIRTGEHQVDAFVAVQILRDIASQAHVDWLHLNWNWLPGGSGSSADLEPIIETPYARGFCAVRRLFERT